MDVTGAARSDEHRMRHTLSPDSEHALSGDSPAPAEIELLAGSMLGNPLLNARANAPVRAEAMRQAQENKGNKAVQRQLSASAGGTAGRTAPVPVQRFSFDDIVEGLGNSGLGKPLELPPGGLEQLGALGFSGPSASVKENQFGGIEGEGQLAGHKGSLFGVPIVHSGGAVEAKRGIFNDGGGVRVGERGTVAGGKVTFNEGGILSGDAGAGTASVEGTVGSTGASFGAQANVGEGSITASSIGKTEGGSDTEESIRVGLSEGGGLAGRLHWGDSDNDKHREFGFGFDAGPLSVDVKSEDPLRTGMGIMGAATGGLGGLSNMADTLVSSATGEKKANLTDAFYSGLSGGGDFNRDVDTAVGTTAGGAKGLFEGLGLSTDPKDLNRMEMGTVDALTGTMGPLGGIPSMLQGAGSLAGSAIEELGSFNPASLF